MLVCNKCGSKDIQVLAWVDANTNEYKEEGTNQYEDMWCNNCESHTFFVYEEEYSQNIEDNEDEEFYDEIFG